MIKSEFIKICIEEVKSIRLTYIRKIFGIMDYVDSNDKKFYDDSDILKVLISLDSIIINGNN
jgi:hypothetical protein